MPTTSREHDADQVCLLIMQIDKLTHALGEVARGALRSDLDLAPGPVRVEEDEQVDRAVAPVLAIVALELPRLCRDRLADLADELGWAFVEAPHRAFGVGRLGVEVEHVLHAGDVVAIDLRDAPHVPAPRLQLVLGQAAAHRLA
jgi:hypothetical protein